jgi:hypothetical protein
MNSFNPLSIPIFSVSFEPNEMIKLTFYNTNVKDKYFSGLFKKFLGTALKSPQRLTIWQVAVCGARFYPPLKKFEAGYNAQYLLLSPPFAICVSVPCMSSAYPRLGF